MLKSMKKSKYGVLLAPVLLILLVQCNTDPAMPGGEIITMPEKKSVLLPNGENYCYIEQIPPDFPPGGDTLLLLHGNFASSVHFAPLFRYLDNVRIVAPDMRGFGDSSYNNEFSALVELADDIKLFAEALNISKAHVVGWSMGGGIALELAVKYPELVSSLFIIEGMSHKGMPFFKVTTNTSPVPYSNKEEMAQFPVLALQLSALEARDAGFFEQSWNMTIYNRKKPKAAENRIYIAETLKQRCLIDVYWALAWFNMSGEHNGYVQGSGTIGSIGCPVTFTSAANDLIITPPVIRENAAAIPGSRLLIYNNCGHSPMVDIPARLASDILKHIR